MPLSLVDALKPIAYQVEKKVVSRAVPDVSKIPNRKKLKAFIGKPVFDHSKWNAVLQKHVYVGVGTIGDVSGINMVDYAGIAADPNFHKYLKQLEQANVSKLSEPEALAFWINAYNALCINIIIQYEKQNDIKVNSITNLTTEGNPVWNQIAGTVGGQEMSLSHIEHDILRGGWDEPLVHACIVCASASCPNLRNEAFVVERLKAQMEDQMREFLSNPTKGLGLVGQKRIEMSRIFLWFQADFGGWNGLTRFLGHYVEEDRLKTLLWLGTPAVRYLEYSWKINRAEGDDLTRKTPVPESAIATPEVALTGDEWA